METSAWFCRHVAEVGGAVDDGDAARAHDGDALFHQVVPFEWEAPLGGVAADDDGGALVAKKLVAERQEVWHQIDVLIGMEHRFARGVEHTDYNCAVCFVDCEVVTMLQVARDVLEKTTRHDASRAPLRVRVVHVHFVPRPAGLSAAGFLLVQATSGVAGKIDFMRNGWDLEGVGHHLGATDVTTGTNPWVGAWG